jgi:hypothetical protein
MDATTLLDQVRARYDGLVAHETWGERVLFYNPDGDRPRGRYFLTVKEHDSDNDRTLALNRPGVYRVSVAPTRASYVARFGPPPERPPNGGVVDTGHDFTVTDTRTTVLPRSTRVGGHSQRPTWCPPDAVCRLRDGAFRAEQDGTRSG